MKKLLISLALGFLILAGTIFFLKKNEFLAPEEKLYEYENLVMGNMSFDVVKINPDKARLELVWKNEAGDNFATINNLANYFELRDKRLVFATNAGIFMEDLRPLGLYIEDGQTLHDINLYADEYGNFYLKPNAVFALDNTGQPSISISEDFSDKNIAFATQSGPLLLYQNEFHPELMPDSDSRKLRSGVGLDNDNNIYFVISNSYVNFYDFASAFHKLGCQSALYLDGSISEMYLPDEGRKNTYEKFGAMFVLTEE